MTAGMVTLLYRKRPDLLVRMKVITERELLLSTSGRYCCFMLSSFRQGVLLFPGAQVLDRG